MRQKLQGVHAMFALVLTANVALFHGTDQIAHLPAITPYGILTGWDGRTLCRGGAAAAVVGKVKAARGGSPRRGCRSE